MTAVRPSSRVMVLSPCQPSGWAVTVPGEHERVVVTVASLLQELAVVVVLGPQHPVANLDLAFEVGEQRGLGVGEH